MVKKSGGSDDRKLFAFLAVFLTVIGFIIALAVKKNDKYVMFYGKQGLILFIAWIVAWIAGMVFWIIPVLGWLLMTVLYLGLLALWIIGLIYSLSGEMKPVPLIGQFAEKISI
jgi:uncharacterized membrane protein